MRLVLVGVRGVRVGHCPMLRGVVWSVCAWSGRSHCGNPSWFVVAAILWVCCFVFDFGVMGGRGDIELGGRGGSGRCLSSSAGLLGKEVGGCKPWGRVLAGELAAVLASCCVWLGE